MSLTACAAGCSLFGKDDKGDNGDNGDKAGHVHSYEATVIFPTCTEKGYTNHRCSCGDSYVDTYVDASGHSFGTHYTDNNATCTEDGTKTAACTRPGCNARDTVTDEGSKLNHLFGEYKSDNNATCTEDGTKTAACTREGCDAHDTVTDEGSKTGHRFIFYSADGNATCTEDGTKTATCLNEGCSQTDTIPNVGGKLGHLFTNYVSNDDFTCSEDGTQTAVCDRAGCNESDTKPDVGSAAHRFVEGFCTVCNNEEYTEGLVFEKSAGDDYYTVKKYQGTQTVVKVPSVYDGLPVKKIGGGAFNDCAQIEQVTLPQTITEIGASAFASCEKLESVNIPSEVTKIGSFAFYSCKALTAVTIPEKVTVIEEKAFYRLTALEELHFNAKACADFDSDDYVFGGAGKASSGVRVTVGDEVTKLPQNIFYVPSTDTVNTINIIFFDSGDGLTYIDANLLMGYENLKEVIIGNNVNTVRGSAFERCTALEKVTLGTSLTAINKNAFYLCEQVEEVYAPNFDMWCALSFNNLYSNPALNAQKLYLDGEEFSGELTIPETLTQIKPYTFVNWKGITGVNFHAGITSIGTEAFRGCTNVEFVNITDVAAWCAAEINSTPLRFCNKLLLNGTLIRELEIPQGVTAIASSAFAYCYSIVKVTLPASLTAIGDNAFLDCYSLAEVENLSSIAIGEPGAMGTSTAHGGIMYNAYGKYGASGTSRLKVIDGCYIYESDIRGYLVGYVGVPDVQLPADCNGKDYEINQYAFYGSDIISVVIPDSVTKINKNAFMNCTQLTAVTMGTGTAEIGANAFAGCSALCSLTLSSGLTKIGNEAFKGCIALTEAVIPDSVMEVGDGAFDGCSSLEEVTVGTGVSTIGKYAFRGTALKRAHFAVAEGWKVYNDPILQNPVYLQNAAEAATNLKNRYADKYWQRQYT